MALVKNMPVQIHSHTDRIAMIDLRCNKSTTNAIKIINGLLHTPSLPCPKPQQMECQNNRTRSNPKQCFQCSQLNHNDCLITASSSVLRKASTYLSICVPSG